MRDYHFHCRECSRVLSPVEPGIKHESFTWEQIAGYCFGCDVMYLESDNGGLGLAVKLARLPNGGYKELIYT